MIQEVGFDNLPNSYIRTIEISELSAFANRVHAHFILKDVKKDGVFSWYNRDELGKYLKLLVVASTNITINSALDNGELPLDRQKISSHPAFDKTQVQFRETKVGWDRSQILDDGIQTPEGELFEMEYGERFFMKSSERDLKIYCATFIDTAEFARDYRLDLTHSEISSYTGPVAAESVFSGGEVVTSSFVFRTTQNGIWSGPTRFLNGTYYSGSTGEPNPSEVLRRVMVPNMKIKDYRKPKLIRTEPSIVDNKLPPFPEPSFSYNPDGSVSALFTIDLRALLLRHSKIANRLAIVDEKLLNKVIQKIQFSRLSIKKVKTGQRGKLKPLVMTNDSSPFNLQPYETESARFEEIVVSSNPNVRHFALRDYEDHKTKGHYNYSLDLEFNDPTKEYIDELGKKVEENLSLLKNYVDRSDMKRNQNKTRTRFTDTFVQRELDRFGLEQQPWNVAAQLFATYYGMFMDLDDNKVKRLAASSISRIHPSFGTPLSTKMFLQEYSELHQHFIKYLQPKIKRTTDLKGRGARGNSFSKGKIIVMKNYKETIIHEERDNTVIYYNFAEDVYPVVSIKELLTRSQNEKDKFYNSKPSLAGTNLAKLSKEAAEKLTKDANNMIGYLTPEAVKAKKEIIDLSNPSAVDIKAFNAIYNKTKGKKEATKMQKKPMKSPKLKIKVAKKIDKYLEPSKKETKTVEENLGKNSNFRSAENIYRPTIESKVLKSVETKLKEKNKKKVSTQQFKADSQNIKKLIKEVNNVRLPPSLISIVASESSSTKNNTLTAKTDLASNPETKDFFALMYTNPVQILTIKGYVRDAKGRQIYSRPIWELLTEEDLETTKPIICKFSIFNTKMFETQGLEVNIANENFVLLPNSAITKTFTIEDTISMQFITNTINSLDNNELDYHTTNPVRQSEDKNGPLR